MKLLLFIIENLSLEKKALKKINRLYLDAKNTEVINVELI